MTRQSGYIEACKNCIHSQQITGGVTQKEKLPNGGTVTRRHIVSELFCFHGTYPDETNRQKALQNAVSQPNVPIGRKKTEIGEPTPLRPVSRNSFCHEHIHRKTRS